MLKLLFDGIVLCTVWHFCYVILCLSGSLILRALYGRGNFDLGKRNSKGLLFAALNLIILLCAIINIFIPIAYLVIIAVLGCYNRKKGITSFTISGKMTGSNQRSPEYKYHYLVNKAPREIIDFCEENYGSDEAIYSYLLKAYGDGKIELEEAEILWERYNSKTDPEVLKYNNATPTSYREIKEKERYMCQSIAREGDSKSGKCTMCHKDADLSLYRVKNIVGTRSIYICDECYERFSEHSI